MKVVPILATAFLTLVIAASPRSAAAEPIAITSGSLVLIPQGGLLHLEGARGLVVDARGSGRAAIMECGPISLCVAGSTVTLNTAWVGSDLGGEVSIDGKTFPVALGTGTTGALSAIFTGSILLPGFSGEEAVSVSAPFNFTGRLSYPAPIGIVPPSPEDLTGRGTATVNLTRGSFGGEGWTVTGATYLFEPFDAEPVPEPTTIILVCWPAWCRWSA